MDYTHQAPLSMEFSRQEYWSGLPFPSPINIIAVNKCQGISGASLIAQTVKHLPTMWETWVRSLGQEDHLEEEMATHFNTLAWKPHGPRIQYATIHGVAVKQDWVTSLQGINMWMHCSEKCNVLIHLILKLISLWDTYCNYHILQMGKLRHIEE